MYSYTISLENLRDMASSKFPEKYSTDISRRQVLKSISQAAVGVTAITQAPYVFAKQRTQLRVLGTHVTLQEELRQKAMQDLDIDLIFEPISEPHLFKTHV